MALRWGSQGDAVKLLQANLNLLPTKLVQLVADGIFGSRTHGRVVEFQGDNKLGKDGVVGPLTTTLIEQLIAALNNIIPQPDPLVRLITDEIVGTFPSKDNLITQILPARGCIDIASYKPGPNGGALQFSFMPLRTGRLAIFAAKKNGVERAAILLLPQNERPDRLLICISQGFGGQGAQTIKTLEGLNWKNPLSPQLINFCLLKHVVNRWGAETLHGRKNMGFLYIVRSAGQELGPFANDGPFVRQALTEMQGLTNNAFSIDQIETMTFSSGISEHNTFVNAISSQLNVVCCYGIDCNPQLHVNAPKGAKRREFRSGVTSKEPPLAGVELLPFGRWSNEMLFNTPAAKDQFNYMHNWTMPQYMLFLGIQTT